MYSKKQQLMYPHVLGLRFLLGLACFFWAFNGYSQSKSDNTLLVPYLVLAKDDRFKKSLYDKQYQLHALGDPFAGAEIAAKEIRFALRVAKASLQLKKVTIRDTANLPAKLDELYGQGARFFLSDLPKAQLVHMTDHLPEQAVIFNLGAQETDLRTQSCRPGKLFHIVPSYDMQYDALAQYLVSKKWRKVRVLHRIAEEDRPRLAAFERSAKRLGLEIEEKKQFVLGKDPRQREQNNVALLTSDGEYDVVVVIDGSGEFATNVPYHTGVPRPVVGSAGLSMEWWHWSWLRHGAPQLNNRMRKKFKRNMAGADWSAWMAVKALGEAVLRTGQSDVIAVRNYLAGNEILLDTFKGYQVNFRPWNGQLRQPILLTTPNHVVARAPIAGFLDKTNNLDTLGVLANETQCRVK